MATNSREKMRNKLRQYWRSHRCCYWQGDFYSYSQLYNKIGKEATKYITEGSWTYKEWIKQSLDTGRILTERTTKEIKYSLLDELFEIAKIMYGAANENKSSGEIRS